MKMDVKYHKISKRIIYFKIRKYGKYQYLIYSLSSYGVDLRNVLFDWYFNLFVLSQVMEKYSQ
jgi:hypothetical protein